MKKTNFHQNLGGRMPGAREEGEVAGTRHPSVKGPSGPRECVPALCCCFQLNKQECEPQKSRSRGPLLWGRGVGGGTQEPRPAGREGAAPGAQPRRMWAAVEKEGGRAGPLRGSGTSPGRPSFELCLPMSHVPRPSRPGWSRGTPTIMVTAPPGMRMRTA